MTASNMDNDAFIHQCMLNMMNTSRLNDANNCEEQSSKNSPFTDDDCSNSLLDYQSALADSLISHVVKFLTSTFYNQDNSSQYLFSLDSES
jgi:hypothetical protein